MNDLRIALVQGETLWHDQDGNRTHYGQLIDSLAGQVDLVVLPETFTSGFSNDAIHNAEVHGGATLQWLQAQAKRLDAAISGSVQIRDGDGVYNRMYFVQPDGTHCHYDKRHLFRFAREHERYAAGSSRQIVDFRGWKILLQVCYDLRFPVFSRNGLDPQTRDAEFDLMLYVANWPAVRRFPWVQLAKARAIENIAYVAAVNRVGTDGNGHEYSGDSAIYDFRGMTVTETAEYTESVTLGVISHDRLQAFRASFPALMDADQFTIS